MVIATKEQESDRKLSITIQTPQETKVVLVVVSSAYLHLLLRLLRLLLPLRPRHLHRRHRRHQVLQVLQVLQVHPNRQAHPAHPRPVSSTSSVKEQPLPKQSTQAVSQTILTSLSKVCLTFFLPLFDH